MCTTYKVLCALSSLTSRLNEAEEKVTSSEKQAKQLVRELSQKYTKEKEVRACTCMSIM